MNCEETLSRLDALGITYEKLDHPAVYTIGEMDNLDITSKCNVVKNLFLRDAKGKRHFLVVLDKDKKADLAGIREQVGCSKLSFASEERLMKHLQLTKGAVTRWAYSETQKPMWRLFSIRTWRAVRTLACIPVTIRLQLSSAMRISLNASKAMATALHC